MKKLIALLAIMVVALGTLMTPTMAAPPDDLNSLAEYFPASAPVLVSFSTSDDFIKDIDDLTAKIAAQIPGMEKPPTIVDQFDKVITEVMGSGNFDTQVRNWLGDVASIGLYTFEGVMGRGNSNGKPPHFLAAISIKDQKAAETFWKAALSKSTQGDYQSSTKGDFILFTPGKASTANGIVAIGKDVMFVASYEEDIPFDGPASPLSESPMFADSMKLLPESDYYVTVYANLADLFQQALAVQSDVTGTSASQAAMMKQLEPLLKNFPPEVIGYTLLDERSLVFDFAVPYGDLLTQFAAAGYSTAMPDPVDPAFAANILSGSPFVIHSTNLGASLAGVLKNFQTQAGMMSSSTGASANEMTQNFEQIKAAIQVFTGKDLENDILPALKGNYALYVTLNPALSDISSQADLTKQLPVDFGFLTEINDPTITPAIMDGVKMAFNMSKTKDAKLTTEKIAGADAVVITGTGANMPFPIELVVTGNDKLFFFGTRRAAQAALMGTGGLDQDASFKEAGGYLVPSPTAIAYLATEGLKPLTKILGMTGSVRDSAQFEVFLKVLSSASVSSTNKDNVGYARFVWTLPE